MRWTLDPKNAFPGIEPGRLWDVCGLIPSFVREDDPRPARDQFNDRYSFGGGVVPIGGGGEIVDTMWTYPGDRPLPPVAVLRLHETETIYIYQHAFVAIVQDGDGSVVMTRMD